MAITDNESPEAVFDHLLYCEIMDFIAYSFAPRSGDSRSIFIQDIFDYFGDNYFYRQFAFQLTTDGDDNIPACSSPDMYKIIYVKNGSEIYMMDNDGMLKEKLTDGHSPTFKESWA